MFVCWEKGGNAPPMVDAGFKMLNTDCMDGQFSGYVKT